MTRAGTQRAGLTVVIDGRHHLAGGRCESCATVVFPAQAACPRCGHGMAVAPLPTDGTVWSWTVQRIPPKPPYVGADPFVPFAVAYVDLGVVCVESPLFGRAVDSWQIGDPVRLAVDVDDSGAVHSFHFVPHHTVAGTVS